MDFLNIFDAMDSVDLKPSEEFAKLPCVEIDGLGPEIFALALQFKGSQMLYNTTKSPFSLGFRLG
jgi:hypothetical protein